jgi:hypothetical protein
MRGIALAILIGLASIERVLSKKEWDQPTETILAAGAILMAVCIALGI